jgi:cell division protein FtsL
VAEGGVMAVRGTIRIALAGAALFASLSLVVWRQSRALEVLRELEAVRAERALVESERGHLTARIQRLEGRGRIRVVAEERFGMRVPTASELVTLRRAPASVGRVGDGAVAAGGRDR